MDRNWGFEETDEFDEFDGSSVFDDRDGGGEDLADMELLTGKDPDGVVTVAVDDAADVVSVRLGGDWRTDAVRRALGAKVVEALTAATVQAMAKRAEAIDPRAAQRVSPLASPDPPMSQQSPITREDAQRLMHAVSADLVRLRHRLSVSFDQPVCVQSAGGHVTVSGRGRQASEVSIDGRWLYTARQPEVESELRDALTTFAARSSPGDLAPEPRSSAIAELLALVSDPQALVRRIRQGSIS